jgi:hypothetical protein
MTNPKTAKGSIKVRTKHAVKVTEAKNLEVKSGLRAGPVHEPGKRTYHNGGLP